MSSNGNANVQRGWGLLVDSSSLSAITAVGNITVNAPTIGGVGNYSAGSNVTLTPTPKTGGIAACDPVSSAQAPTGGACAHPNFRLTGTSASVADPLEL